METGLTADQIKAMGGIINSPSTDYSHLPPPPSSGNGLTADEIKAKGGTFNYPPMNPNQTAEALGGSTAVQDNWLKSSGKTVGHIAEESLPIIGGVAGGIAGAVLGAGAGGVGAFPGAVGGSAVGGALGETAKEYIQKLTGERKDLSPTEIASSGLVQGAGELAGGPVASLAGKGIQAGGKALYETAVPMSIKEAGLVQSFKAENPFLKRLAGAFAGSTKEPSTAASTAFSKGLKGTESMLGVQAKRETKNIWNNIISPALKKSSVKQDMPSFFNEALDSIIKNTKELGDREAKFNALQSIMKEYESKPTATMEELQGFKEGWASHVPEKYYKGKDITQTYNSVRAELSDLARTKIYNALGDEAKQAYFDYGNLKSIQELGKKAMTGGKLKGGFGSFWSGIKDIALTPVATVGGRSIYRAGQGVEFSGKTGVKTLGELFRSLVQDDSTSSEETPQ